MFITKELIERSPLPRHEILHLVRGWLESFHRQRIYHFSAKLPYRPCARLLHSLCTKKYPLHEDISEMDVEQAQDFCNKTVPIYAFYRSSTAFYTFELIFNVLHNWLYRKWFQPYRSEIDYGQFIAKTIIPSHVPSDMELKPLIDLVLSLNATLCNQVASVKQKMKEHPEEVLPGDSGQSATNKALEDQDFFILQPTFKALAIIFLIDRFNHEAPDDGQVPVLLLRTGVEDGLSAPITFEPIAHKIQACISKNSVQTSLETAVDFVMDLERREIAAFGRKPDPVECPKGLRNSFIAVSEDDFYEGWLRQLGWDEGPLDGPSSLWVDMDRYPEWSGPGAIDDVICYGRRETAARRRFKQTLAEEEKGEES